LYQIGLVADRKVIGYFGFRTRIIICGDRIVGQKSIILDLIGATGLPQNTSAKSRTERKRIFADGSIGGPGACCIWIGQYNALLEIPRNDARGDAIGIDLIVRKIEIKKEKRQRFPVIEPCGSGLLFLIGQTRIVGV
jgi:hypothetical protein